MCKLKLSLVIPTADKHYSFKEQVKAATYRYKCAQLFVLKKKASLGRRTLAHLAIHRCAIFTLLQRETTSFCELMLSEDLHRGLVNA